MDNNANIIYSPPDIMIGTKLMSLYLKTDLTLYKRCHTL